LFEFTGAPWPLARHVGQSGVVAAAASQSAGDATAARVAEPTSHAAWFAAHESVKVSDVSAQ